MNDSQRKILWTKRAWLRWVLIDLVVGVISLVSGARGAQAQFMGLAPQGADQVQVSAEFTAPEGTRPSYLFITVRIKPDHYIYSLTQPPGGPRPTRIRLAESQDFRLAGTFQASPPPQRKLDPLFNNLPVEYHVEEVTWFAPLEWREGVDLSQAVIAGRVQVQVCDQTSCYPPQEFAFEARLGSGREIPSGEELGSSPARAVPPGQAGAPSPRAQVSASFTLWAGILAAAFLGGLILNLMPCVLPVISLKLFALIEQAGQSRTKILALNLWYTLGLLSVFFVLATLSAAFNMAWGQQFTYTWFKVALVGLVFALALSFLGVWELPIPGFATGSRVSQLQMKEGAAGAFFKGVFTTILATPCAGPFLGSVFAFTLDQPPIVSYVVFGMVGLGMAFPYLMVAIVPGVLRFLPRPGAWMEILKEIMGFFLLGAVVYLFSTINAKYFIPTLAFVVGLWFACWLVGKVPLTVGTLRRALTWVIAIGIVAGSAGFSFTALIPRELIPWEPFVPERVDLARQEGRTVMIDFTADWCPNCKFNLATAIETPRVAQLIAEYNVLPLLADWTDESPVIKDFLTQRLRRRSIPVLAIYPPGASDEEAIILDGILVESQVLDALRQAGPSRVGAGSN